MEAYEKSVPTGKVLDLGTNYADAVEAWYVPTYLIKGDPERGIEPMAPDLKSIDDLPNTGNYSKTQRTRPRNAFTPASLAGSVKKLINGSLRPTS